MCKNQHPIKFKTAGAKNKAAVVIRKRFINHNRHTAIKRIEEKPEKKCAKTNDTKENIDLRVMKVTALNSKIEIDNLLATLKKPERKSAKTNDTKENIQLRVAKVTALKPKLKIDNLKATLKKSPTPVNKKVGNSQNGFSCDYCGRRYQYGFNMQKHKKFSCGGAPQFECPHCSRKFHHKGRMELHAKHYCRATH